MKTAEIVEIDLDPKEQRRAFWRKLLRYGLPLAAIALITAGLIAGTLFTNAMNRSDVLGLSRDFIDALNEQVYTELRAYLGPAHNAVGNLSAAVPDDPWSDRARDTFERMGLDALRRNPQLASVYFATPKGEFFMVRRNDRGTADSKRIDRGAEGPRVSWSRRDESGRVVAVENDPEDRYDPRTRGWYQDAMATAGVRWSKVYTFFTDRTPGITASIALEQDGAKQIAVVGADIFLNSLSDLLASLQTKARGTLAIVNGEGQVIAFHEPGKVVLETAEGVRSRTIRELDLPVLAEAFDRLRIQGAGRSTVVIDGETYIFGAASLQAAVSRDWWLLLLAPEQAYLGFVAANGRRGLIASSGIVVLSILMAVLLCYQGIRSDRDNRTLRGLRDDFSAYRRLQADLAGVSNLSDPTDEQDLQRASEILARAEAARRISFWRLAPGQGLVCLDAFEEEARGHIAGVVLHATDCAELLAELAAGRMIDVADTRTDPRTAAIYPTYFRAVGTGAVYSVPIRLANRVLGAIWIEDPEAEQAITLNHNLTRTVANLLAARLAAIAANERAKAEASPGNSDQGKVMVATEAVDGLPARGGRAVSLSEKRQAVQDETAAESAAATSVFAGATVLTLRLLDDRVLAVRTSEQEAGAIIRDVVGAFEQAADDKGISYVKFLTDRILAVDGFGDRDEGAAERLVDVALTVRDRCGAIFLAAGRGPQFAMGIDSGTVFGATVGSGDGLYTVWGEALRVADQLAETTDPGSIQVSETSYDLLRGSCVFRRRGSFYLDQVGEMSTFVLRGRT